MIKLGLVEDFTQDADLLDAQLKGYASSGIALNLGVHPSVNLRNILAFLPKSEIVFADWDEEIDYQPFEASRNRRDVVMVEDVMYQCITENTAELPPNVNWVETNLESTLLKQFIFSVKDRVFNSLMLTNRLIESRYIYNEGKTDVLPTSDYIGWAIEAKGSDYIAFQLNEMFAQIAATGTIEVYVVNQGVLVGTLDLPVYDGAVKFTSMNYQFSGKGTYCFLIDSALIKTKYGFTDPFIHDSFSAYTVTANGISPESAEIAISSQANGIGLNLSTFLNPLVYIEYNLQGFGAFFRAAFEFMAFEMMLTNSMNRVNHDARNQMDKQLLVTEVKDTSVDSSITRFLREEKAARKLISNTFDTQIKPDNTYGITVNETV